MILILHQTLQRTFKWLFFFVTLKQITKRNKVNSFMQHTFKTIMEHKISAKGKPSQF